VAPQDTGRGQKGRHDRIYEIPAEIILQPGPACLTDGLDTLMELLAEEA
jgi:hypothetical protein